MRKCARCGEEKPVDEFAWKNEAKGWRQSYCRPCWVEYTHERYVANREKYLAAAGVRNRQRRVDRTAWLLQYFE